MKKRAFALLLAAVLMTGLTACGSGEGTDTKAETETESEMTGEDAETTPTAEPTPTEEPVPEPVVFSAGFGELPDSLDPALTGNRAGLTLAVNCFAGLYTENEAGEVLPALASEMPVISDDGTVYTITLKKTVWSDGSALTAGDFIYSWNRAARAETGAPYGYLLTDIIARNDDGTLMAEASGDRKLVVTLQHPAPYFTELLTMPVFFPVPEKAVAAADPEGTAPGAWTEGEGFLSNGAFCYAGTAGDDKLIFRKNPVFYGAAAVKADQLEVVISRDDGYTADAYDCGELDYVDVIPASMAAAADAHTVTGTGTYYLVFNASSDYFSNKSAWQAMTFRKAVSMLIDRPAVAERAGGIAADSLIPPGMSDGNGGVYKDETVSYLDASGPDIAQARGLLEGCGYRFTENEDKTLTVEPAITLPFLTTESEGHLAVAEELREDLAVLGIDLVVESLPWDDYYAALMSGQYVLAREGWPADYNDPACLLERFASDSAASGLTLGRREAPQAPVWTGYDSLIQEIRMGTDAAVRANQLRQAERTLMETWCVIPVYYYGVRCLLSPEIDGAYCDMFGKAHFR